MSDELIPDHVYRWGLYRRSHLDNCAGVEAMTPEIIIIAGAALLLVSFVLIYLLMRANARAGARYQKLVTENERLRIRHAALQAKYDRLTDRDARGRFVKREK